MPHKTDRTQEDHEASTRVEPEHGWWGWAQPRWRTVILAIVAVSAMAGSVVVLNSPLLEIRQIEVSGTRYLTDEAVAQLSGLRGTNLLLANLGDARERVLALPLVEGVAVQREWPNRIRIEVVERTPRARWAVKNQMFAIDAEGIVLEGLVAPVDSPLVRQTSSVPVVRGGAQVDVDALKLIERIEELGEPADGPTILAYEWSLRRGLTVVTQHGHVTFGDSAGFEFKYEVWEELEREAQRRGEPLLAADLRFGTRPAVEIGLGLGRATRITEP